MLIGIVRGRSENQFVRIRRLEGGVVNEFYGLVEQPLRSHFTHNAIDARLGAAITSRQSVDRHATPESTVDFFFDVVSQGLRRVRKDGCVWMELVVVFQSVPNRFDGAPRFTGDAAADFGRAAAGPRQSTSTVDDFIAFGIRHLSKLATPLDVACMPGDESLDG